MDAVIAYPQFGKRKSIDICAAFVAGCGGRVELSGRYQGGPAFFYGINDSNVAVWKAVRESGADYYYSDNSYFDATRGTHFRVTRNAVQHDGHGCSDGKRFAKLGITIEPWRRGGGDYIVVCPQSDAFMKTIAGWRGLWLPTAMQAIRQFTSRPTRVREWSPDKKALAATLRDDLEGAAALVTYSSAAAITAVLAGVPAVCMGPCAARPVSIDIADIESPQYAERAQWAGVLADRQWTLEELRAGAAWKVLQQ